MVGQLYSQDIFGVLPKLWGKIWVRPDMPQTVHPTRIHDKPEALSFLRPRGQKRIDDAVGIHRVRGGGATLRDPDMLSWIKVLIGHDRLYGEMNGIPSLLVVEDGPQGIQGICCYASLVSVAHTLCFL